MDDLKVSSAPIGDIAPGPNPTRRTLDAVHVRALALDFERRVKRGLPPLRQPLEVEGGLPLRLIDGHHRLAAALEVVRRGELAPASAAGRARPALLRLPVVVVPPAALDPLDELRANLLRLEPSAAEAARATWEAREAARLRGRAPPALRELAALVSCDPATLSARAAAWGRAGPDLREAWLARRVSAAAALRLSRLSPEAQAAELRRRASARRYSPRRTVGPRRLLAELEAGRWRVEGPATTRAAVLDLARWLARQGDRPEWLHG